MHRDLKHQVDQLRHRNPETQIWQCLGQVDGLVELRRPDWPEGRKISWPARRGAPVIPGSSVRVGFVDGILQLGCVLGLSGPAGGAGLAQPPAPIPIELIGLWLQAESGYRKDNLGLFRGIGLDAESHAEVLSWDTGEQLANTADRRVWPLGLVASNNHLFGFFPVYSSTSISNVKLRIWKFSADLGIEDEEELTYYYASEEDYIADTQTPLPLTLPSLLHQLPFSGSHMLPAQNQVFVTPGVFGSPDEVGLTLIPYPQSDLSEVTADAYQLRFDVGTRILIGPVASTIDCDEGWRGLHTSVVKDTMAQIHLAASGGRFASKVGNPWEWPSDSRAHRQWDLMGAFAGGDDRAGGLEGPFAQALWSNNAPARRSDDPGHNWVYPFPTYHFDTWLWRLWQVQFSAADNGAPVSAEVIQSQAVPASGTPLPIESLLAAWDAYFSGLNEESESETHRSHAYSCLQEVAPDSETGGWYDCDDPCVGAPFPCNSPSMEASGCTRYAAVDLSLPTGSTTTSTVWGGRTTAQIADTYGLVPPQPGERAYRGIALPLPAGRPNFEGPTLARHRWMNFSDGIGSGQIYRLDPAVVFSEDGYSYQAITRSYPVYVPGQLITTLDVGVSQPGGPERPEEEELCTTVTQRAWAICGCALVDGPYEEQVWEWGCPACCQCSVGPIENQVGGYTLPEDVVFGNFANITTHYHYPHTSDLSETCLVIGEPSGTSFQLIPISDSHSGATAAGPEDSDVTIVEELKVPENVWQIIPIPTAANLLLVLTDGRPGFEASPRPILQLRNRLTGALISTYTGLVPEAIQEQAYESDVDVGGETPEIAIFAGEAKWHFHGRMIPDAGAGRGYYVGEVPGPRMKATWPGKNSEGDPLSGDVYVHLSAELYEKVDPTAVVSTFKSRTEYRCLKVTSAGFEVVRTAGSERTNTLTVDGEHLDVQFPSDLPRPDGLRHMMALGDRLIYPTPDDSGSGWKLKRIGG